MIMVIGFAGQSCASALVSGKVINTTAANNLKQWSGIMCMGFSIRSLE
jgi:hypothetical protein